MGGDAAWDIGLAHPDLWAGVLPVVATADKYVSRYWKNAKGLPMYFVAGQLDGNKIAANARDLDRYMKYAGFDAMYVEYEGRGHEHFADEILRMFEWMALYKRDFARKEFTVTSMRPWDQFFWWVELGEIPERFVVLPANWPQPKAKDAETEAQITQGNTIRVKTPSENVTVWLSPELSISTKKIAFGASGSISCPRSMCMLEDVRTRGDRQHPFWAKYSPPDAVPTLVPVTRSRGRRSPQASIPDLTRLPSRATVLAQQAAGHEPAVVLAADVHAGRAQVPAHRIEFRHLRPVDLLLPQNPLLVRTQEPVEHFAERPSWPPASCLAESVRTSDDRLHPCA